METQRRCPTCNSDQLAYGGTVIGLRRGREVVGASRDLWRCACGFETELLTVAGRRTRMVFLVLFSLVAVAGALRALTLGPGFGLPEPGATPPVPGNTGGAAVDTAVGYLLGATAAMVVGVALGLGLLFDALRRGRMPLAGEAGGADTPPVDSRPSPPAADDVEALRAGLLALFASIHAEHDVYIGSDEFDEVSKRRRRLVAQLAERVRGLPSREVAGWLAQLHEVFEPTLRDDPYARGRVSELLCAAERRA